MTALTPRQRLVLEYLAAHGGSTAVEVAHGVGLTNTHARDALVMLHYHRRVARQGSLMGMPERYLWHLEQAGVDALRGVET